VWPDDEGKIMVHYPNGGEEWIKYDVWLEIIAGTNWNEVKAKTDGSSGISVGKIIGRNGGQIQQRGLGKA